MEIRDATAEDAVGACAVMRRSITELCALDHRSDPALLARWLANKTPATVAQWIANLEASVLLACEGNTILAVGSVSNAGEIMLNYVSPDARFRGVSKMVLHALEERAIARGNQRCRLISTVTARRFYLSAGYVEDGTSINTFGMEGQPMSKALKP
ncbi:MAG TPA: GNAT family N-acetyltransferase [Magnetospirillaceae bacterium]|jgi:GNAT superfamily N-acetyltransferase